MTFLKRKKSQSNTIFYLVLASFFFLVFVLAWLSYLFSSAAISYYTRSLPEDVAVTAEFYPQSTRVYSRDRQLLYQYSPAGTRFYAKLEEFPNHLIDAFLAVEDHRFYKHNGMSPIAIARASLANLRAGEAVQGGSTITQQLARILFLSPEVSLERKVKEMVLAFRLEQIYTKRELLELYLNKISFGSDLHGVEAASLAFFDKHASELSLSESAILAAMPKAPSDLFPYRNRARLLQRQKIVLDLMASYGYTTPGRARLAKEEPVEFHEIESSFSAPHFVYYTLGELKKRVGGPDLSRGFDVVTTLDLSLQQEAQKIVQDYIESVGDKYKVENAALVALNARTGDILAMVGSKDFSELEFGQFNAALAKRQPGSALKPLVYGLAFDKLGLDQNSYLRDVYTRIGDYSPRNFDRSYHGWVTAREALVYSYNIPAVKLLNEVGVEETVSDLHRCGLSLDSDAGLSLAVGGAATDLLSLTGAYSVFPGQGECRIPSPFLRVENKSTGAAYNFREENLADSDLNPASSSPQRIFSKKAASEVDSILKKSKSSYSILGYLRSNPVFQNVAFKTGTSDGPLDAWTVGYVDDIIVGVWMGNNDNSTMKNDVYALKATVPLWAQFMEHYLLHAENAE